MLFNALAIVLGINIMMFLAQAAILDLDSDAGVFYNCEGTILAEFEKGNCESDAYLLTDDDPSNNFPSGATSVNPDTGNIFTDGFSGIKGWLFESTGLSYVVAILSAPSSILKAMGLPSAFSFAVGALWYGLTFLLIIAFAFGRDT